MLGLAALCVVLGVGAACVAPVISAVADSLTTSQQHFEAVRQGVLVPGADAATGLSPTLVMLLLLGGMLLPLLLFMAGRADRLPMRRKNDPWACGYGYEERMALSAGSFTQGLRHVFAGLYHLRQALDPAPAMQADGITEEDPDQRRQFETCPQCKRKQTLGLKPRQEV